MVARKYYFSTDSVKRILFKTYMYSTYGCPLWSRFYSMNLKIINVCYNMVMRRLMGVPPWHSAREMFVTNHVRSFPENRRTLSYSLLKRIDQCPNRNMFILSCSDAATISNIRNHWNDILYVQFPQVAILFLIFSSYLLSLGLLQVCVVYHYYFFGLH